MAYVKCDCGFQKGNLPDAHIGKRGKCPKCPSKLTAMAGEPPKPAPAEPPSPGPARKPPRPAPAVSAKTAGEVRLAQKEPPPAAPKQRKPGAAPRLAEKPSPAAPSKREEPPAPRREVPRRPRSEFSLLKYPQHVDWKRTYLVNLIRTNGVFVPFIVLNLLFLPFSIVGAISSGNLGMSQILGNMPTVVGIILYGSFLFLAAPISIGLASLGLKKLVDFRIPFAGLFHFLMVLPIILFGDPFYFLVKRLKPDLLEVEGIGFFNLTGCILVLDETFE